MDSARYPASDAGLVVNTHELGRGPGRAMRLHRQVDAPADLGIGVIGVPAGSPVELDLQLESAGEGVLVTGTAGVILVGQCVRCLADLSEESVADLQELYLYPENVAADDDPDEIRQLSGELLDLEPALRDAVVIDLPFQPLCRPDCAGLCSQCGADLNAEPGHQHAASSDPRWAALSDWLAGNARASQN
jgi:uncharacterized protein